jgi:colanic acid biosynthesis protein WcaH
MFIPSDIYNEVIKMMPIPCVDLMVFNKKEQLLMLKRKNEPAKGNWWFPGGRVQHGELRSMAAIRKLNEECGMSTRVIKELGTYDVLLKFSDETLSHAITTVYKIIVSDISVKIDFQSEEYNWKTPEAWLNEVSDDFLKICIKKYS